MPPVADDTHSALPQKLDNEKIQQKACAYALWLLGRRSYTRAKLCEKLAAKFDAPVVDGALDTCERAGYINDCALINSEAEHMVSNKPINRPQFRAKLSSRGFSFDNIVRAEQHVQQQYEIGALSTIGGVVPEEIFQWRGVVVRLPSVWSALALCAYHALQLADPGCDTEKAVRRLQLRGHSMHDIRQAVRHVES